MRPQQPHAARRTAAGPKALGFCYASGLLAGENAAANALGQ